MEWCTFLKIEWCTCTTQVHLNLSLFPKYLKYPLLIYLRDPVKTFPKDKVFLKDNGRTTVKTLKI